ncbi:hypothetical protein [Spirabiliibacterium mucosae]|uniref:hypothetical protein n=1 Tax=Spirabiliibacterium mucosae TaxID=28156 RepID=UPI00249D9732|nr:hypothetical protein [Spirabiliibacterium mucosae]
MYNLHGGNGNDTITDFDKAQGDKIVIKGTEVDFKASDKGHAEWNASEHKLTFYSGDTYQYENSVTVNGASGSSLDEFLRANVEFLV